MLKSNKGISLTTAVVTVLIMIIILSTITYSTSNNVSIRKLNKLYNDIRQLNDAVAVYYLKNNELPVDAILYNVTKGDSVEENGNLGFVFKSGVTKFNSAEDLVNPNDYDETFSGDPSKKGGAFYYKINTSLLENLSLNYNKSEDVFIINEKSHMIYYFCKKDENNVTGITVDGKSYHTIPLEYRNVNYN